MGGGPRESSRRWKSGDALLRRDWRKKGMEEAEEAEEDEAEEDRQGIPDQT